MTIGEIKKLNFNKAKRMSLEVMNIKDHDCVFVDFNDDFGYSVLVFKNDRHIYYANDYELHHKHIIKKHGKEALREYYIKEMFEKLYTDQELLEDVKTYDEYKKKDYFLRNYWIMRYDNLSIFGIGEEAKKEFDRKKESFPYFNPISFCYVSNEKIVYTSRRFSEHLKKAYKFIKENTEEFRKMVRYELANHEACITCDYSDALQALGLKFEELTEEKQNIVLEELRKQIENY